jgi:hypothetical protein
VLFIAAVNFLSLVCLLPLFDQGQNGSAGSSFAFPV